MKNSKFIEKIVQITILMFAIAVLLSPASAIPAATPADQNFDSVGAGDKGTQSYTLDGVTYTTNDGDGLNINIVNDGNIASGGDLALGYRSSGVGQTTQVTFGTSDGSEFKLNGFVISIGLGDTTVMIKGYRNNTEIASVSIDTTDYTPFDVSAEPGWEYIDEVRMTGTDLDIDIDDIDFSPAVLPTYTVTYNGNTNTAGSVPTDGNSYNSSENVTVLSNIGNLLKSSYTFTGWNTAANGSGTSYDGGDTFSMGSSNVILYAQWARIPVPLANFTSNVTSGNSPLPVSFTDLSLNSPTGWAWYFGDEDMSGAWTEVNSNAWPAREYFSTVVLPDGSIVLMGGTGVEEQNDVWRSEDSGATWVQMTSSAGWSARQEHSSVALPDGSIVLMGGIDSEGNKNDVWRSMDNGASWVQMTSSAGWTARYDHSSVVLSDGSIVLMGGRDDVELKNDVWRSTNNGTTWTELNSSAGWSARAGHSSVVLPDGSIVLMGGGDIGDRTNDVWRSTDDGSTWTELNSSAGWSARDYHSSVVLPDGSIVLMGGIEVGDNSLNDVWLSTDGGATWKELNPGADWSARSTHRSVVLPDGSIVLMGGFNNPTLYNDVWRLTTTGSSQQNPSHTYTEGGTYQVSLQAYNSGGYNSTILTNYITVSSGPFVATTVNASYTSVTYDENDIMIVDLGILVNGSSTFTSARVYIGDGYVSGEDFLRFTNTSCINGSFNPLTGILSLSGSGSAADYQESFRNVRYENINDDPNTSDRNITFVMGDNAVYLESTGHYYESIYPGSAISWTDARAAAEARSLSGMQGYLATILTEEESAFLESKAPDNAWIGANDAAVEREWRWVTGPENLTGEGTLFYYQDNSTTIPGFYTNWNSGEPNDWEGVEDYGQILGAGNKKCNDLPNVADVYYYLVEYGGMPNETAPQLTAKITVNVNSVNDAPTTPGNFTSPVNGQIKQGGQLMTASWGISTDLEDDAVRYDLWFFNGSWTKIGDLLNTNSKTFSLPSDNTNTAMFRVYANDTHDNSSARDVTFTIDSLGPVIVYGTNGNTTYSKSHNTTATGTDAVAGLAQISYAWTNDSEMSSVSSWTDFVNGAALAQDTVSGDWYLHINATDNVSNSNYSVSNAFKLDNILPLIHFGTDGNATYAQSHSTNVTVVDPLSGIQSLAYSWSNDSNVSSVSQWTVFNNGATLSRDSVEGDWYLHIRATDNASNTNYSVSSSFALDNSLPVIHFGTNGNTTSAQSHSTTVTAVDVLSGIQSLAYSWANDSNVSSVSQWTAFNNGATLTRDSGEGDCYLHIRAIDNAGNTNYSVSNAFVLDNTLPVLSITGNPASWQNTSAVLNVSIDDLSGVSQVKWDTGILNYTYFASSGNILSSPYSFEVSGNGNYTVYARDLAGNENATVFTVSYIDTALPSIGPAPNGNSTYCQSHSSTITSLDSLSGVQSIAYSWSQNSNVGLVSSWTVCNSGDMVTQDSANGNWYLHVRSIDNAGNVNYSTSDVFRLDNGLPVIHFGTDGNATYAQSHSTDVTVVDSLSGIHELSYAWAQNTNVGSVSQWTAFYNGDALTKNSGDGNWYLHIRAVDNAGNTNYSVSSNFRLDNTVPAYTWIQKPLNADTGDSVVIKLDATDVSSVSECIITVDGEEHQMNTSSGGYSWTVDIPASDSGTLVSKVIYSCTLSDLVGNVGSTGNVRMNVSILPLADFTASETTGTAPLTVGFEDGSFGLVEDWHWDFGDGSTSTEQNPVHTFGPGDFTVNLTVTNSNGTSSQQLNVRVAEPLSCTTSPEDTELISIYGEETNFSATANIVSSFNWYIDGEPISGNGITMSSNDDDSSSLSFCTINTSEYIDQDDFFVDDYNISVVVSNETTGMSDTFSWDWIVTNSSAAENGEEISFVISQVAEITSSGNMSYVGFNTTDDEKMDNSNLTGSITFVSFATPGNASDLRIKIEVLDKSSLNESEAGFSQDSVYQYLDISFNNQTLVDNTGLNRSIKFRVLNERDGGSLAITSVMLKHWGDPAWESYVPELLNNDGIYSYFIVRNISGFSPFAITANYEYSSGSGSGSGTGKAVVMPLSSQEVTGKAGALASSGSGGSKVSSVTSSSEGARDGSGDKAQSNDGIGSEADSSNNNRHNNIAAAGIVLLAGAFLIFFLYRKIKE